MDIHLIDQHGRLESEAVEALHNAHNLTTGKLWSGLAELEPQPTVVLGVWDADNAAFFTMVRDALEELSDAVQLYLLVDRPLVGKDFMRFQTSGVAGTIPLTVGADGLLGAVDAIQSDLEDSGASVVEMGLRNRLFQLSHQIVSQFPAGVLLFNGAGKAVWANPFSCEVLGLEYDDVIGEAFENIFPEPIVHTIDEFWKILSSTECIEPLQIQYPRKQRTFHISFYPTQDEETGQVIGVAAMIFVTNTYADSFALKVRKMGALAAETLQDLESLEKGVELAQQSIAGDGKEADYILSRTLPDINKVENTVTELGGLANELAESHLATYEYFDLEETLENIFSAYEHHLERRQLTIRRKGFAEADLDYFGDAALFFRIFNNIVRNVIRHSVSGSTLVAFVQPDEEEDGLTLGIRYTPRRALDAATVEQLLATKKSKMRVDFGNIMNLRIIRKTLNDLDCGFELVVEENGDLSYMVQLGSPKAPKTIDSGVTRLQQLPFISLLTLERNGALEDYFTDVAMSARGLPRLLPDLVQLQEALSSPGDHHVLVNVLEFGDDLPIVAKMAVENRARRLILGMFAAEEGESRPRSCSFRGLANLENLAAKLVKHLPENAGPSPVIGLIGGTRNITPVLEGAQAPELMKLLVVPVGKDLSLPEDGPEPDLMLVNATAGFDAIAGTLKRVCLNEHYAEKPLVLVIQDRLASGHVACVPFGTTAGGTMTPEPLQLAKLIRGEETHAKA